MLDHVGLPHNTAERYPHEFSGEERQRLGFARALILEPELIVADETGQRTGCVDPGPGAEPNGGCCATSGSPTCSSPTTWPPVPVYPHRGDVPRRGGRPSGRGIPDSRAPLHPGPDRLSAGRRPAGRGGQSEIRSARRAAERMKPPSGCRFRTHRPLAQDHPPPARPATRTLASQNPGSCALPPIIGSRPLASRLPGASPPAGAARTLTRATARTTHGSYPGHRIRQPRPQYTPARTTQPRKPPRTRHRICRALTYRFI
jgi:hypothetical protein